MNQTRETEGQRGRGAIIPPDLAIRAMRDSGYKNTAYALAEIIDNAIQANATSIELICVESKQKVTQRTQKRTSVIGVLDNGEGMSAETLEIALQFGNGTHLKDRKGMGRFGMGLPNSSINQCRRLEVWTWQSSPDNAMYSYLDLDEIEGEQCSFVPKPEPKPLPKVWRERSATSLGTTGTLVLWSKFDEHRLTWKTAKSILRHTESIVGRMYRKFINDGRITIRLLALLDGESTYDETVRVNDPLYLMENSSTPDPFDKKPMFQKWGVGDEVRYICYNGKEHEVIIRISWALPETVTDDKSDRGSKPYGKHAAKNIGLSIVREGRELDLDEKWANGEPTERWWGVEVEFPSALDEVFGVTNNKQSATTFSHLAQYDWKLDADDGESASVVQQRLMDEDEQGAALLSIATHIRTQIHQVRLRLKDQTKHRRTRSDRHDMPTVADLATSKFKERARKGHETDTDREKFTEADRRSVKEDLETDKRYSEDAAEQIANAIFSRNRKVEFVTKAMDSYAFFNVEHKHGGLTLVVFNNKHPFYGQLMESLEPKVEEEETDSDLLDRIHKAADTLKLLFVAWARYEMEDAGDKYHFFDMRQEWGKMARFFLTESKD